jgi:hypothetical protein
LNGWTPTREALDAERFDNLARGFASGALSRRATLKAFALGAAASLFLRPQDAEAAGCGGECAKRNWCENRTHTCGPPGKHGKCLVKKFGGKNICAKIVGPAETCDDCAEPNCSNCICLHAAGGGDKCNNGVNGFDFMCVRKV